VTSSTDDQGVRLLKIGASAVLAVGLTVPGAGPAAAVTTVVAIEGASPDGAAVSLGAPESIVESTTVPIQAPFISYGMDVGTAAAPVRRVSVPYFTMYDFVHPWTYGQKDSVNGGVSFQTGTYHGSAVALDDGPSLAWDTDFAAPAPVGPTRKFNLQYYSPAEATWTPAAQADVNISPLSFATGARFYPDSVIQVPGGPLLMGGHGNAPDMTGMLLQSIDNGAHWTLRSVIGAGTPTLDYTEVGIVLNSVGDLVTVIRSQNPNIHDDTGYFNLKIRRSADLGLSWETSAPVALPAAFDARIMPRLSLLPNGMLVLVGGRSHNWIAVSAAGDGRSWEFIDTFYRNYPSGITGDQTLNYGSSGNASLAWTESNRVLLTADTCHVLKNLDTGVVTNNCTRDGKLSPNTVPGIQRVLADVLRRGTGKIDLASKFRAGTVQVGTTLGSTFAAHPRTGPAAAFDGSTELWSSAIAAGAAQGTFDITLDAVHTLNRIGLSQSIGHTQSTMVQTKLNAGDPWSDWFTAGPRKSFALTHYEPTPRQARYVRLVTGASDGCLPGAGASCSVLNEVELYSTVDSFENDPLSGAPPRGWVTKETVVDGAGRIGCWVTQSTSGSGSSRALVINDVYPDHLPTAFAKAPAAASRTVEFRAKVTQRPASGGTLLFSIRNTSALTFQNDEFAYHFGLNRDGSITYHAGGSWHPLAPANTVTPTDWNKITLQLTAASATVSANGVVVGTAPRADGASGSLFGPQFGSSSTLGTGEQYLIDDVLIT
jgi:hypothetical protein